MKWKRATVSFCRLHYAFGQSLPGEIKIDLKRRCSPIRVYLHELLHVKHWDWSERKVMRMEKKIWDRMSQKQIFFLGKRLFNRKWREYDKND